MEIRKNGKALDLGPDFSMQIDDTNPVFNELGSQSVPATVPVTRRNMELMNGIHRADAGINPNLPEQSVDVIDGAYMRRGTLNVTEAGRKEGITFNIGFDNSTAYQKWQQKKMTELGNLPVRYPAENLTMFGSLQRVYQGNAPTDSTGEYRFEDVAVFPIAINVEEKDGHQYWEILNSPNKAGTGLFSPSEVARIIDGTKTIVRVPRDYGISPFLKVWKMLELVFQDLGLEILNNPFKNDKELARIVVLNNTADTICRDELNYRDLMPDSTVMEFLKALWVRFGLVYNVNFDNKTVDLRLLRDIVLNPSWAQIALDNLATDLEFIRYLPPQYVRLSAGTSIDGAQPAKERFEDYINGLDVKDVKMGPEINSWQQNRDGDWNRELYDGYADDREDPDWDDPDYPDPPDPDYDPDEDRDDGREDREDPWEDWDWGDYYATRSGEPVMPLEETEIPKTMLAREFVTGRWFKLDTENGKTREDSSSFFNWDPKPEGMEPFELSSSDECVPVKKILKMADTGEDFQIYDYFPLFTVGARHFHSYIVGSDNEEETHDDTPLAFMIAYTTGGRTIGRLAPETEGGVRLVLDDGSRPTLTLFFQFGDGLFARFWSAFDEILRHGNREIELPMRISKLRLKEIDLLKPVSIHGLRCLVDKYSYTLPSGRELSLDMTLRAIHTMGDYDIQAEQKIPDFHVIRKLEWKFKETEDLNAMYESPEFRSMAADETLPSVRWWRLDGKSGFTPDKGFHVVIRRRENYRVEKDTGNLLTDAGVGIQQLSPLPELRFPAATPSYSGQRNTSMDNDVRFYYDIYEVEDGSNLSKIAPTGFATVYTNYRAIYVARFVPD